jgi:hypothetical protein
MSDGYPVSFDVPMQQTFDRAQILLRVIVFWFLGWIPGLLYYALPVVAALWVSQKGAQRFLQEDAPKVTGWIRLAMAFYAYLFMFSDRLPLERPEEVVTLEVQPGGNPSVGSALLRFFLAIPSAFVLGILYFVAYVMWVVAAIQVLTQGNFSEGTANFFRGVLAWQARLFAYVGSLVEPYPPFALETGPRPTAA